MNPLAASHGPDPARIKVLVAHGLPVVSAGLAATLAKEAMFDVLACAAWDSEHDELSAHERCDVIVTDRQGAPSWIVRARSHPRTSPDSPPRILIVDDSDGEAQVRAALSAGVHGYMLTDCGLRELVEGIGLLGKGGRYLCASVASRMAESLTRTALTPRETDVLALMVKGHSNKIIARQLGIAVGTVKAHSKAVFEKLGVRTRSQAVALSNQRGLVPEASFN
jgi:DNA-binding NarL/FixJ family response regulator